MDWGWVLPFVLGVLVGMALMWIAALVNMAHQEEQRPERLR